MRARTTVVAILFAILVAAAVAAAADPSDEELAEPPGTGGGAGPGAGGGVRTPLPDFGAHHVRYAAWAGVAIVIGLVVGSSLAKVPPVPRDPLVTMPGAPGASAVSAPRRARASAEEMEFDGGRDLAHQAAPATVVDALALMRTLGLGSATLERDVRGEKQVTLRGCGSCSGRRRRRFRRAPRATECAFERGFLHGAMELALGRDVVVSETRCAGPGGDACEFVIRY